MIVQEREPIVYTTSSSEWSAASTILAGAIVALLGFMVYYFAVMHAARVDDFASPSAPIVLEHSIPVPTPVPQPILIPTPSSTAVTSPSP